MRENPPVPLWPDLLELPADTVNVVYLDLNHWIYLAQALAGHPNGKSFTKVLEACRAVRSAGSAIFVLSETHYYEVAKIKDPAQRRTVADVMEELTEFATLASRVAVMELELAAMLDRIRKSNNTFRTIPLVGRGILHAMGRKGGLRIMGPSSDVTERVRQHIGAKEFDGTVNGMDLFLERSMLRGPTDEEVDKLRAQGWNPEAATRVAKRRAAHEQTLAHQLDGTGSWRRGRLHDLVSARELTIEFQDIFPDTLAKRGLTLKEVLPDRQSGRAFVRSMPSTDVAIELKTAWHRNRDKHWNANDIHDIDAMSVAVPYCDIVVTDKACHNALVAAHIGERMNTALLRNLLELPKTLANWKPKRPRVRAS